MTARARTRVGGALLVVIVIGYLIGNGSLAVFETWGYAQHGRTFVPAHRRLWRIIGNQTPRITSSRLPANASDPVAIDAGRIILLAKHGVAVLDTSGHVQQRIQTPAPASVRLGDDLLGAVHNNTLRVYSANTGRLRYQLELAHASGTPTLLSIRNGYAAYTSGIEVHVVRLRDRTDRVLNLPGTTGTRRRPPQPARPIRFLRPKLQRARRPDLVRTMVEDPLARQAGAEVEVLLASAN